MRRTSCATRQRASASAEPRGVAGRDVRPTGRRREGGDLVATRRTLRRPPARWRSAGPPAHRGPKKNSRKSMTRTLPGPDRSRAAPTHSTRDDRLTGPLGRLGRSCRPGGMPEGRRRWSGCWRNLPLAGAVNVLLVEPCSLGQVPVASVCQPAYRCSAGRPGADRYRPGTPLRQQFGVGRHMSAAAYCALRSGRMPSEAKKIARLRLGRVGAGGGVGAAEAAGNERGDQGRSTQ